MTKPEDLLRGLGGRVRRARAARGVTAREIAERAGLSQRFYGQLEAGQANIAFTRLCAVADALGVAVTDLVTDLPAPLARRPVLALLGLRGAGKSTLGPLLARERGAAFHELDDLIERRAGMSVSEIFALHGESFYRRLATQSLREIVQADAPCVVAVPGGIVHDEGAWRLLRESCVTAWLRARPQDHMDRVVRQGDRRPMADRADAMGELRALLAAREPLYSQADLTVDTSRGSRQDAARALLDGLERLGWKPAA